MGCVHLLNVVLKSISNKIAIYHTHQDRVEHWYEEHCEYRSPDIDPGDYNKNIDNLIYTLGLGYFHVEGPTDILLQTCHIYMFIKIQEVWNMCNCEHEPNWCV